MASSSSTPAAPTMPGHSTDRAPTAPVETFLSPWGTICTSLPGEQVVHAFIEDLIPRGAHWSIFNPDTYPLGPDWGQSFNDSGFVDACLGLLYSEASGPSHGFLGFIATDWMVEFNPMRGRALAPVAWLQHAVTRAWSRFDAVPSQVTNGAYSDINDDIVNIQGRVANFASCPLLTNSSISSRYNVAAENRPFNVVFSDNSRLSAWHPLQRLLWSESPIYRLVRLLLYLPKEPPASFVWPLNWWTVNYPGELVAQECLLNNSVLGNVSGLSVPLVALPASMRTTITTQADALRTSANEYRNLSAALYGLSIETGLDMLLLPSLLLRGPGERVAGILDGVADWLGRLVHPDAGLNDTLAMLLASLNQAIDQARSLGDEESAEDARKNAGQLFGDLTTAEIDGLIISLLTFGPMTTAEMPSRAGTPIAAPGDLRGAELLRDLFPWTDLTTVSHAPVFHVRTESPLFSHFNTWGQFELNRFPEAVSRTNPSDGTIEFIALRSWLERAGPTIQFAECLESARSILELGLKTDSVVFAADTLLCGKGSVQQTIRELLTDAGWDCLGEFTNGHGVTCIVSGIWRQMVADAFLGRTMRGTRLSNEVDPMRCVYEIFCWMRRSSDRSVIDDMLGPLVEDFDWDDWRVDPDAQFPIYGRPSWRDYQQGILWSLCGADADTGKTFCERWRALSCSERETAQRFADIMANRTCVETLLESIESAGSINPIAGPFDLQAPDEAVFDSARFGFEWQQSNQRGWWGEIDTTAQRWWFDSDWTAQRYLGVDALQFASSGISSWKEVRFE